MSIVIREQDILKKDAPNHIGNWDKDSIRAYQEAHGINYGGSVFCRGIEPNREWSNDRTFGGSDEVTQVNTDALRESATSEIDDLKAQMESLKEMIASMAASLKPIEPLHNVERHGLKPDVDKRTREYRDAKKAA